MKKARVLIVDDSADFREALKDFLDAEGSVEVVGEAADGFDAVKKVESLRPDVVLLDLRMPHVDGLSALQEIKEIAPQTKVLVLSVLDERECVREAFNLGASGYLVKDFNEFELPTIVQQVASGRVYVHPLVTHQLLSQLKQVETGKLNETEKKVLLLLSEGHSDKRISEGLDLSLTETRNLINQVLGKVKAKEKVQEIAVKLRHQQSS